MPERFIVVIETPNGWHESNDFIPIIEGDRYFPETLTGLHVISIQKVPEEEAASR
jgi:hypothetical protein